MLDDISSLLGPSIDNFNRTIRFDSILVERVDLESLRIKVLDFINRMDIGEITRKLNNSDNCILFTMECYLHGSLEF